MAISKTLVPESIPATMKAAAIDRFGGPDELHVEVLPVPVPTAEQVLIQLDSAGVGVWDPSVREGEFTLGEPRFPMVIGNDGAGTVIATGANVTRFQPGDRVYAYAMEGGFYAEYVAVDADEVAPIPRGLSPEQAGALGADGVTALIGLEDELQLRPGEKLMIFGASGGIGHLAVQLAKRLGAEVLAVASGADGVQLTGRLGADLAIDGRSEDVERAARQFAPQGLDAALVLATGAGLENALTAVKKDGRIAYPNGVEDVPKVPPGVRSLAYDGEPTPAAFDRLNQLIGDGPFHVEVGRVYPLAEAARAHRELAQHHLGKLALRVRGTA
jgi:NADPH:quinone reductase-like Zn-dependent oxidoreductase